MAAIVTHLELHNDSSRWADSGGCQSSTLGFVNLTLETLAARPPVEA